MKACCITSALNSMDARIRMLPIYKFIKNYISYIPVLTFERGEYLFRAEEKDKTIYYILGGTVEIESVSYNGKKLVIENAQKNMFAGFITDMQDVTLQFSGIALTRVKVLVFSESLMEELMKNDKFSVFFYQETGSRMLKAYKMVLSRLLFSADEILAYYILDNAPNKVFAYESSYKLSESIGISRRGIYNILHRYEDLGCIKKRAPSMYEITDEACLENRATYVSSFMKN